MLADVSPPDECQIDMASVGQYYALYSLSIHEFCFPFSGGVVHMCCVITPHLS